MPESRNEEVLFVLIGPGDIIVLRNRDLSVSGQGIHPISVGNVDRREVFLMLQRREFRDTSPRSLGGAVDCGVGWLEVVISEDSQWFRDTGTDLCGVHC